MKRLIFIICFLISIGTASFAEEQTNKELYLTLQGISSHKEYETIINAIKKLDGVTNLIPTFITTKEQKLSGEITATANTFSNDVKAFAMDKYQASIKESSKKTEVTLKKL